MVDIIIFSLKTYIQIWRHVRCCKVCPGMLKFEQNPQYCLVGWVVLKAVCYEKGGV